MAEERRKSGPRRKGVRRQFTIRVPEEQFAVYEAAALAADGLDVGDYIAARLAEAHDLPVPSYIGRWPREQQAALFQAAG